MNEVNINKYLSQFNPILIVPVLSAVVGAILVFLFGFKRPNEPRFHPNSSIDNKKSKKGKKTTDIAVAVASKKGSVNSNNNNNNSNNNVNKKKSENGSPAKKVLNKKNVKESTNFITKKSKTNKNNSSDGAEYGKPADFDDDGWFTVQSKSTKQKNKIDDSTANQTENSSPKVQSTKNIKSSKIDTKQLIAQVTSDALDILLSDQQSKSEQQSNVDQSFNIAEAHVVEPVITIDDQPADHVTNNVLAQSESEKKCTATAPHDVADFNAIAFDELEEWTDAKPDRKRANKKKTRKDI